MEEVQGEIFQGEILSLEKSFSKRLRFRGKGNRESITMNKAKTNEIGQLLFLGHWPLVGRFAKWDLENYRITTDL